MAIETNQIIEGIIILGFFLLSALPLKRAVKIVKKRKIKFYKVLIIVALTGIGVAIINYFINVYASIAAFIFLIWVYKKYFKLKWYKAFFVWILQLVFVFIGSVITSILLNVYSKITIFFS